MPRRPSRSTVAPDPTKAALMRLDPALALLAAVVQQALSDVRSPSSDIRHDALRFLCDEAALQWWGDVLGVGDALQRQVQAVLRDGR